MSLGKLVENTDLLVEPHAAARKHYVFKILGLKSDAAAEVYEDGLLRTPLREGFFNQPNSLKIRRIFNFDELVLEDAEIFFQKFFFRS